MTEGIPSDVKVRFKSRLQAELVDLRTASAATSQDRQPVTLDQQSVGRLSRMDALQQQAMAAAQDGRRHARIRTVEAALRRIETDDFGWCDACGDAIGDGRLDLDPALARCRSCAG